MKKFLVAELMFAPMAAFAQKFAHVNTQEIIQVMPEYTKAKGEIDALTKQYEDDLKNMQDEMQTKAADYEAELKKNPERPQKIKKRSEKALQQMQQKKQQRHG